mmetsp:Transcript_6789/g.16010  ORF Transcript_6789/g.16010 Transcript_6789/m.16010 type:complete len:132 (+) Transcript_6789:164-559(+)
MESCTERLGDRLHPQGLYTAVLLTCTILWCMPRHLWRFSISNSEDSEPARVSVQQMGNADGSCTYQPAAVSGLLQLGKSLCEPAVDLVNDRTSARGDLLEDAAPASAAGNVGNLNGLVAHPFQHRFSNKLL